MIFATFYKMSTGYVAGSIPPRFDGPKKPIAALGSDGVAIFDGRFSIERCAGEARAIASKRGYVGFVIERGSSFTNCYLVRAYEAINA